VRIIFGCQRAAVRPKHRSSGDRFSAHRLQIKLQLSTKIFPPWTSDVKDIFDHSAAFHTFNVPSISSSKILNEKDGRPFQLRPVGPDDYQHLSEVSASSMSTSVVLIFFSVLWRAGDNEASGKENFSPLSFKLAELTE